MEPPQPEDKLAALSDIAQEAGVEWDVAAAARELLPAGVGWRYQGLGRRHSDLNLPLTLRMPNQVLHLSTAITGAPLPWHHTQTL